MIVNILFIVIALLVSITLIKYIIASVNENGILCVSIITLTFILFYIIVPLSYIIFSDKRDYSTAYNILLSSYSNFDIIICLTLCVVLIYFFVFSYRMKIYKDRLGIYKNNYCDEFNYAIDWHQVNLRCKNKIEKIADVTFLLGFLSIFICIVSAGGIEKYLALGSVTRGVDKNVSDYISSAALPLITLSAIILATPYLYKYLLGMGKRSFLLRIKFASSFVIALVYLLYNQGRVPLLLFVVPFILNIKMAKKMKVESLIITAGICLFLLEPLSNLFNYVNYGVSYDVASKGIIETLTLEFTYPFVNFMSKNELLSSFGYRLGIDYIQWPLLLVPSSVLQVIGISKSALQTIGSLNTNAYKELVGFVGGGIPTDVFTFNYYQFGVLSLILGIIVCARLLKAIDRRIIRVKRNDATKIISYRICLLCISLVNNFDLSVIMRMRFDLLILVYVLFYISKERRK